MPFLRQFVNEDDCIVGSEFFSECQKEHFNENKAEIRMYLFAKCCIERETNLNAYRSIITGLINRRFTIHNAQGDYLLGKELLSKRCSIGDVNLISRTGSHRGHQFKIFCNPDPLVCFINETVRMSPDILYAQKVRIDETATLL